MQMFFQVPYLFQVFISLLLILVFNRILKQLLLSVLLATVLLAFWSGHSFGAAIDISSHKLSAPNTLMLALVVWQVIILSHAMSLSGSMQTLVEYSSDSLTKKKALAVLPALIGLLPMPGGAVFSAPLVEDCDRDNSLSGLHKTQINYWFRHIWEYWWPLYPGVLLAIELSHLPVLTFILLLFPLSLFSVFTGTMFFLRNIEDAKKPDKSIKRKTIKDFFLALLPVLLVILTYALIKIFFPALANLNKYLPILIGIVLAQLALQFMRPLSYKDWKRIIFSLKSFKIILLLFVVLLYGAFISAKLPDGIYLMDHIRGELQHYHISLIFIVILLPFISAMATGMAIGFVGASFPIIMNLVSAPVSGGEFYSLVVLAYFSGYMGMILSPVHICLILTNNHFHTSLYSSIIKLIKPVSLMFVLAGAYVYFLSFL